MQLSYSQNMRPAIAGTLYDLSPHTIDSCIAQGNVGFGFGVIVGTDPQNQATIPAATFSTGFKGVAMIQSHEQPYNSTASTQYADKETMPVVRKGRVWVNFASGQAITAESAAYLIFSGADAGKWTNAAGAGSVAVAVSGAKFITSNTSTTGGVVAVELS